MNKIKTNLFKIAKANPTYWILLFIATVVMIGFYVYLRQSLFY